MTLCHLMIEDFMHGHGIWDPNLKQKTMSNRNYDQRNLLFGIEYAQALMEEGFKQEPFYHYNLKLFIKWAEIKLRLKIFKSK